jgi:hypothetical protein
VIPLLPLTKRPLWLCACLVALAAALATLLAPAPAVAAKPCYLQLIDDWQKDGRIDKDYPKSCYLEAQRNLPEDLRDYSELPDVIDRSLAGLVDRGRGSGGSGSNPSGDHRTIPGASSGTRNATGPQADRPVDSNGVFGRAIDWLGPDNADSVPLPLIVLAGIGFLLLAAGGAGYAARRIQARRLGLPPPGPES